MSELKVKIEKLKSMKEEIKSIPRFVSEPVITYKHEEFDIGEVAKMISHIAEGYIEDEEEQAFLMESAYIIHNREKEIKERSSKQVESRAALVKEYDKLSTEIKVEMQKSCDKEMKMKFSYHSVLKKQISEEAEALLTIFLTKEEIPFIVENKRIVFLASTDKITDTREYLSAVSKKEGNKTLQEMMKSYCQRSLFDFTSLKSPLEIIM